MNYKRQRMAGVSFISNGLGVFHFLRLRGPIVEHYLPPDMRGYNRMSTFICQTILLIVITWIQVAFTQLL